MNQDKKTDILLESEKGNGRLKYWTSFMLSVIISGYSFLVIQPGIRGDYQTMLASLMIGTVLIGGLLLYRGLFQKARLPITGLELPFLLSLLALVVSSLLSPNPRLGISPFVLLVICVLIFYILYDGLDVYLDQSGLITGLLLFSGFVLFLSLGEILLHYFYWWIGTGSIIPLPPTPYRVTSIAGHSNGLIIYLNICAPFAIVGFFLSKKNKSRFFYLIWTILFLFVVPFTSSRGGWLSSFAWLTFISVSWITKESQRQRLNHSWESKTRIQKGILLVVFPVFAVMVIILWSYFGNHPSHGGPGTNLFSSRSKIYLTAIIVWLEKPIFGAGPGSFPFNYIEHEKSFAPGFWAHDAHSLPLQILSEYGLLVFVTLLSVIISVWLIFCKRIKKSNYTKINWWTIGALTSVIGFFVNSLFADPSDALFLLIPLILSFTIFFKWLMPKKMTFPKIVLSTLLAPAIMIFIVQIWILWVYKPMNQGLHEAEHENWVKSAELISKTAKRDQAMPFFQMHAGLAWSRVWLINDDIDALNVALEYFRKSYELEPRNPVVISNMAVLEWYSDKKFDAIEHMEIAVEMVPRETSFWLNLAWFEEQMGMKSIAIENYQNALSTNPDLHTHPFFEQTPLRLLAVNKWKELHISNNKIEQSKKDLYWKKAIDAFTNNDQKNAKKWMAYSSWLQEPWHHLQVINYMMLKKKNNFHAVSIFISRLARNQSLKNIGENFLAIYNYKGLNFGFVPYYIHVQPDYGQIHQLSQIKNELDTSEQEKIYCINLLIKDMTKGGIDNDYIKNKHCHQFLE